MAVGDNEKPHFLEQLKMMKDDEKELLEFDVYSSIKMILSSEILAEKKIITKSEKDLQINKKLKNIYTDAKFLKKINYLLKEETIREMVFSNVELGL